MTMIRTAIGIALAASMACGGGRMRMPSQPVPDDSSLTLRVQTALKNAPDVHANEIQVAVSGAVVTLTGEVHGDKEVAGAVAAARSVAGVRAVKSELKPK